MDESIAPALISLLLPWLMGSAWVFFLIRKTCRWNWFIVIGHGYLFGIFSTTLLIRGLAAIGLYPDFWFLAAILLLLAAALAFLQQKTGSRTQPGPGYEVLPTWQTTIISLLIGIIAWRYLTLAQELSIRPLYAWDAWMNWAPRAVVWFHSQELVSFVDPPQWLAQSPGSNNYSLGNYFASAYPPTVPLIILWGMLATGTADSTLIYLPWIIVPLSLGLAMYGHLRIAGVSALLSCIACYMLLSLPYINTHTALVGYADLWVAAAFGMAIFSLYEWQEKRSRRYALLCLIYAAMCSQLKNPGIVLCLIVLLALCRSTLQLSPRGALVSVILLATVASIFIAIGINVDVPLLGYFSISSEGITVPALGSFTFEYHPVSEAFITTLFSMINWNMLWYILLLFLSITVYRKDIFQAPSPVTLAVFLNMAFVAFAFYFTERHWEATQFTTLNRALVYSVPAIAFYLCLVLANPKGPGRLN